MRFAIPPPKLDQKASAQTRSHRRAIRTRAASGIAHFDALLAAEAAAAPEHQLVDVDDIGALAAFLVNDGARRINGAIISVDGGQRVIA